MKALGARWSIVDRIDGRQVTYHNLVRDLTFNCGTTQDDLMSIVRFIVSEGDPGDMVFLNNSFYTQVHKEASA